MTGEPASSRTFIQTLYPEGLMRAIRDASLEPRKLSVMPETSEIARLVCPRVCLDFATLGPSMWFTGMMAADSFTLAFVTKCPEAGHSFNFQVDYHDGFIGFYTPDGALDAITPRGYANATLTIPREVFHSAAAVYCPSLPAWVLERGVGILIPEDEQRVLHSLLRDIMDVLRNEPESFSGAEALGEAEENLLCAFLEALQSGCRQFSRSKRDRMIARHRRFCEARDFVAANLDSPIQLRDICKEVQLSNRGLENIFLDFTGISPSTYLRHQKLHTARRRLMEATYRPGLIKKVALDLGFWHLGRFASYYREFFGESPSETCIAYSDRIEKPKR